MHSLPFHPLINAWFTDTYGEPTPVQEEAWPLIAKGEHVLALAPTGSGKTLTGFLAAISRFAEGVYDASKLSVLYVSPLKALNEDIRRNLTLPLEGIRARFEEAGKEFPAVRVETRSGDTPQAERRRFLLRPPSILALTPESLGILLLNPRGRQALSTIRYVILDEIHAALGSKRGSYLSCQIDRLAMTAGEFQRVALSATVNPPEAAAEFAGGLIKCSGGRNSSSGPGLHTSIHDDKWEKRKVRIVAPPAAKELQFRVIFNSNDVGDACEAGNSSDVADASTEYTGVERYGQRYAELVKFIIDRVKANSGGQTANGTILVFTDSRRRAERISYLLNRAAEENAGYSGRPFSYCHHGSLSKEVRRAVEKALVDGETSCVVATGSLELGIDIGNVNEVILAGSPGTVAVALQRIGRSGHGVGMTSRGWLMPFHGLDLLQAAAVAGAVEEKELEAVACIENPLDILAQIILALCAEREWNEDELFSTIRGFWVYRNLSRLSYDGVVRMLAGAYEGNVYGDDEFLPEHFGRASGARLRELKRRIFRDDKTGVLSPAPGTLLLLYTSGGVIASRGYYSLRLASNRENAKTKIGELDEEFVWERRLGDCFDFGNSSWRITAIGDEAVEVVPIPAGADSVPFWKGDTAYRSPILSRRILEILEGYHRKGWTSLKAEKMLGCFSEEAKSVLESFLLEQSISQKEVPLPGPERIPVEIVDNPEGRGDAYLVLLHSFRGGAINFPLSLALAREIEVSINMRIESAADDNAVFIRLPRSVTKDPSGIILDSLRRLSEGELGEKRFRERLESSGVFGAAFREAAERSLVLPRTPFGKRTPLWIIRQRSKRLFDAVSPYRDFPVSAEAWRTCLREQFDMEGFVSLLGEIGSGALILDFFRTRRNSPFSKEMAWAETNALMYEYDERPDLKGPISQNNAGPSLSDRVIAEALGDAAARPTLKAELVSDYCSRLRRELPGWAPEDALTLSEWVKERVAIPDDEWEKLLEYIPQELKDTLRGDKSLGGKLIYLKREGAGTAVVVHREWAKQWKEAKAAVLTEHCLGQWLRYEGPIPLSRIMEVFGTTRAGVEEAVRALAEEEEIALDVRLDKSGGGLVCDRENLELILRLSRRRMRPEVKERPAQVLVPFLARRQGLVNNVKEDAPWKNMDGIEAPAKLWETEFFPCRCPSYTGALLDREIREGRLVWYGAGKEKAAFCRPEDLDLFLPVSDTPPFSGKLTPDFFDSPRNFWEIKEALSQPSDTAGGSPSDSSAAGITGGLGSVAEALWGEAWSGRLSADSWEPLRRALELGFTSAESSFNARLAENNSGGAGSVIGRRSLRVPRAIRERWKAGPPVRGNWFSLAGDAPAMEGPNVLEEEELNRDRVRLLLKRWGVLARPLLEREIPSLSWSRLLPSIRRMELAGELVAGRFFGGINSLQFASPRIAEELEEAEAEQGIYWMNAADPASPAGLAVEEIMGHITESSRAQLRRVSASRLCFRGSELLAVSNRGGRDIEIYISPDDPDIAGILRFIKVPRARSIQPEMKITIEKINGRSAAGSAYSSILAGMGFVKDRGKLVLW